MVYVAEDKPSDHNGCVDNACRETILHLKKSMAQTEDDAVIFLTGDTGTGKSTLLQNIINIYSGDEDYSNSNTTFNLKDYSDKMLELGKRAHALISEGKSPIGGYVAGDEFDYQSIENQTKQNRGLDKIFNTVRQYQIFQGLCWPEMEKIPKALVRNRVKLIFVLDSKESANRTYILYTKDGIRRMINDGIDSIDSTTLTSKKIVDKYAAVAGWFKDNKNIKDPKYKIAKSQAILDRLQKWNDALNEKEDSQTNIGRPPQSIVNKGQRYTLSQAVTMLGLPASKESRALVSAQLAKLSKIGKIDMRDVYKGSGQYAIDENTINLLQSEVYTISN